jgi:hypothetical protein
MTVQLSIPEVQEIAPGVWEASIGPRDMRAIGSAGSSIGEVSVLLLEDSYEFEREKSLLRFELHAAHVLNVGRTTKALLIAAVDIRRPKVNIQKSNDIDKLFGPGDRRFLRAIEQLPEGLTKAGKRLLANVRSHFPGDLRALTEGRRFQETPDNFWFVTIQPRDLSLAITVRGLPSRFQVERLRIVKDRPPYSRFKVKDAADVDEAVSVICSAVRKSE